MRKRRLAEDDPGFKMRSGWEGSILFVPKDVVKLILQRLAVADLRSCVFSCKYLCGCAKELLTSQLRQIFDPSGRFSDQEVPLAMACCLEWPQKLCSCETVAFLTPLSSSEHLWMWSTAQERLPPCQYGLCYPNNRHRLATLEGVRYLLDQHKGFDAFRTARRQELLAPSDTRLVVERRKRLVRSMHFWKVAIDDVALPVQKIISSTVDGRAIWDQARRAIVVVGQMKERYGANEWKAEVAHVGGPKSVLNAVWRRKSIESARDALLKLLAKQ